ncbi:addiction module antidote protein, HigA family [Kaistia algarum]|uniref:HigA family addiction module antitoxin n=1 Tax=Kaistia algarum TaxID=2083279 RepID=UPI000CE7756F|nr:HigA family addiction module antitoxin [Kaistia algarum]MCX5515255.1 HigA family addiction module antitoxin [Kaistia algarum]PPE79963.1 addiction module antidote protein, HigA family [Kaistia algarum]
MSAESLARRPHRAPTHPGVLLRDTVLPALNNMSITQMADTLRVSRQQLHRVLAAEAGISPEMALRLGKFCGNGPELWLNMQRNYDLWQARERIGKEVDAIPTMAVA